MSRVASRVGDFIDKITPHNHNKMGGSMVVGHSLFNGNAGSQAHLNKQHQNSSNAIVKEKKSSEKAGESTIGLNPAAENKAISGPMKTMGNSTTP